jgi:hypothetical protein
LKFLVTLNTGSQTAEEIFFAEFVRNLENQLKETKEKLDKLRKEFSVRYKLKYLN